jgi:aspartate/methionine/tyrosine aminotransferase
MAAKAKSIYINLTKENDYKPTINENDLKKTDLVILNFPNNPTASTMSIDDYKPWIELALKYDFTLLNDECYSEIYFDKPQPSLLEASKEFGNESFKNILVVNSISKRSSAPGLRSGFIAGDGDILKDYLKYRTYTGCAVPMPLQYGAKSAWDDEEHVKVFREKYKKNFILAKEILGINPPEATFYIWLEVENDIEFTKALYKEKNLKVIPGSFLSRDNQGRNNVRIALVENEDKTREALMRLKDLL